MYLQEGLRILQEDGLVFKCYESLHDTVWNSELGSSVAIFKAGYTIDSLMLKYQGADWTNLDNWNCNAGCAHTLSCVASVPCGACKHHCNHKLQRGTQHIGEAYALVENVTAARR